MVPLKFLENNITWVVSKLSGAAGELVMEAINIKQYLLRFGFASQYLRVDVSKLAKWIANSSPPWVA